MWRSLLLISVLFLLLMPARVQAQDLGDDYEEILVYLKIQGVGGTEINAIFSYSDNRLLLPVTDLFTILRINQQTSPRYDSVSGYLLQETKPYLINYPERYIAVGKDTTRLHDKDVLKTNFGLFLYTGIYGRAFGLHCKFNFRALSVDLKTDMELPAVRDMRLAQMRKNIDMLKGEVHVDTTIGREYHWLRFGMLDWAVTSTQISGSNSLTRLSTAIGAEVLGGETNAVINYTTNRDFDLRNQQFNWRWANNKSKYLRQVSVGKISPGSIASVYDPFYGILITNTPTSFRRSFGEYNLTGYTEPGWSVELYVNNVLVDYKKADASGFYAFEVPLVYGASNVVVKLYGPYGEERIREEPINIPYNFLPQGELEYILKGGFVDDSLKSTFMRAEASYGVNRFVTIGGGMESYAYIQKNKEIPFLKASFSPVPNMIVTAEYADKVRTQAALSYRLPSNASIELDYARYKPGQEAIRFNYLEERRITVSLPMQRGFLNGYTRLGFKQNVYENFNYSTVEFLISNSFGPMSVNLTSYANWTSGIKPFFNSTASAAMRLGRGYTARSQAQVDMNKMEVISYRVELEKRISRQGYASVNYEENLRGGTQSVNLSFRYDLPFAQANVSGRFSGRDVQTTQGIRGSLAFGSGNGYVNVDNRAVTGRGGLTLIPFLDINFNNKRDKGEPLISGLDLKVNGGRFLSRKKDSVTRVMDLEPYTSYLLEMSNSGFDNIAWQLRDKTIRVYIDPNQFKRIEIPVLPMGEVNGMVYIMEGRQLYGQGRIIVWIFKADGTPVKKLLTETDGYFTFLGLAPGKYYATPDAVQMSKLGWSYQPEKIEFTIRPSEWGDIVDGLEFTIDKTGNDRVQNTTDAAPSEAGVAPSKPEPEKKEAVPEKRPEKEPVPENQTKKQPSRAKQDTPVVLQPKDAGTEKTADTLKTQTPQVTGEVKTGKAFNPQAGRYFVQLASCPTVSIAGRIFRNAEGKISCPAGIVQVDDAYKIRLGYFETRVAAQSCYEELKAKGFDAFIGIDENKTIQVVDPTASTNRPAPAAAGDTAATRTSVPDQKDENVQLEKTPADETPVATPSVKKP